MSKNNAQFQAESAVPAALGETESSKKALLVLLLATEEEPFDWSAFFQQAILGLSLNVRLGFSRFMSFFKADLKVGEKIADLKSSYQAKCGLFVKLKESKLFSSFDDVFTLDPAVSDALKKLEIRWRFGEAASVQREFDQIQGEITNISTPSSPRESKRQDVKPHQQGNEKPIGSIADLVSKVVQILSQFTSETPQCLAG